MRHKRYSDSELIDRLEALLKRKNADVQKVLTMAKKRLTWADAPEILTPRQVQEILQISRATFYRWIEAGQLPGAVKIGDSWRVLRDKLRESLEDSSL